MTLTSDYSSICYSHNLLLCHFYTKIVEGQCRIGRGSDFRMNTSVFLLTYSIIGFIINVAFD